MSILYTPLSLTSPKISRRMAGKSTAMWFSLIIDILNSMIEIYDFLIGVMASCCCWLTGFFTFSPNSEEMPVSGGGSVIFWNDPMCHVMTNRLPANLKWIMKYSNLIWSIWSKSRINSIETFSINFLLCIHLEKYRDLILITMQSLKKVPILSENIQQMEDTY